MMNYIKADLYRNFNRLYFWTFVGSFSVLGILFNVLLRATNSDMGISGLMFFGIQALNVPIFLVGMMIDIVISEENKNLTLKNVVSFGLSRDKIVLSKLVTAFILSLIAAVIILVFFFSSGGIISGLGNGFSVEFLKDFLIRLIVAVPLWTAAIALGIFISLIFKNNTVFAFAYFGILTITSPIIKTLSVLISDKIMIVHRYLITTNLVNLRMENLTNSDFLFSALVGIGYIVVFTILSVIYFRRREIV